MAVPLNCVPPPPPPPPLRPLGLELQSTLLEAKLVQGLIIRGSDEIWAVMSPNTSPRLDNRSVPVINNEVTSDRNPEYRHCHESGTESARTHNVPSCLVHSCQQKSIGLKFSKSQTGSDVRYSCHHNSSRFTFHIFAHSCCFSVLHSLQSITPRIY